MGTRHFIHRGERIKKKKSFSFGRKEKNVAENFTDFFQNRIFNVSNLHRTNFGPKWVPVVLRWRREKHLRHAYELSTRRSLRNLRMHFRRLALRSQAMHI